MDTTITMRSTKAEMLARIHAQDALMRSAALERQELRTRISVLEGTAALRAAPAEPQLVWRGGVRCHVFVTRNGASVTKRFVPVAEQ